jgi:apolipoprotein N-acyltransferase
MPSLARFLNRFSGVAALGAGLVSATGFAPLGLWPLTIIALAVLVHLVANARTAWHAARIGWLFGLGNFVLGLNWIATAFTYQAAMPAWLGWVAVVLLSLYLGVYPALATALAWVMRGNRLAFVLALAGAWIANEWLRATVFTGFAWNPIGAVWVGLPGVEAARLIGTYGLSALGILAGGALWLAAARHGRAALIAAALPAAAVLFGLVAPWTSGPPGPPIRIVQPNIAQQDKWRDDFREETWRRLAVLTGLPRAEPRIVFWPEVAVPDYLADEPQARTRAATLLGPRDLLLTGAVSLEMRGDQVTAARNSLFGLDAAGRILGRYDKAHLVPYGEYLPMRPILSAIGLSRLAPGDLDFLPGPGPRNVLLPGVGPMGVQICYEMIFSGNVVDPADRPRFLFNPSNDAWFGRWGPPQHLAQARLRAVEEGLPVIRSTPTGISAVVDADGRLLAALPWRTMGSIDARLPAARSATPFARLGNLLAFAFAAVLGIAGFAIRLRSR